VSAENLPPVDLTGLNGEQLIQVKQLLYDERESFAKDDDDVGCIPRVDKGFNYNELETCPEKLCVNTATLVPRGQTVHRGSLKSWIY
jgi:hypothetical protein